MNLKRDKFIQYIREQSDFLSELADELEQGNNNPDVLWGIELDKFLEWEDGSIILKE